MAFQSKRRFDLIEMALLCLLFAAAGGGIVKWRTPATSNPEAASLAERYGRARHSEHEEEWIVRDFFKDRRSGVFVDVGANDYKVFSNTYYLETNLGWSGIAIEPQREFEAGYVTHRPRTRFLPFFVGERSNQAAKLYVSSANHLVTSADSGFTSRWGGTLKEVTAPTITLDDLLDHEKVSAIDFLSIDIELHEPQALAGFNIDRFRPALVCVEAHPEVRQRILDYFARHQYVVLGRYLRADTQNLYFAPLAAGENR